MALSAWYQALNLRPCRQLLPLLAGLSFFVS